MMMTTTTNLKLLLIHALMLVIPGLAAAQSNHWMPLIAESKWILHVRVDKVSPPSLFVSNFHISRDLEYKSLDTLYINPQRTGEGEKNVPPLSILYRTGAANTTDKDVAVREGFEYIVFIKEVDAQGQCLLVNNFIGIVQYDAICANEIRAACKKMGQKK
jgi:hypothetical protein